MSVAQQLKAVAVHVPGVLVDLAKLRHPCLAVVVDDKVVDLAALRVEEVVAFASPEAVVRASGTCAEQRQGRHARGVEARGVVVHWPGQVLCLGVEPHVAVDKDLLVGRASHVLGQVVDGAHPARVEVVLRRGRVEASRLVVHRMPPHLGHSTAHKAAGSGADCRRGSLVHQSRVLDGAVAGGAAEGAKLGANHDAIFLARVAVGLQDEVVALSHVGI
mmetsp:Transcript_45528/g.116494  ORF Transcript_45528/g.116494 Transcript_45528/m.116494 type:complete len:218 (+) Transcript_45528:780-1433(+)